MEQVLTAWNEIDTEQEEEYQTLLRALRWTEGFGLLFVECSPAQAERIIERAQENTPEKKIEVLQLEESIGNLYDIVADLPEQSKINILFIRGIEKSLVEYIKPGYGGQGEYYKEDTVPRILGHLNLQRERFRDNFNICFVFLLPVFALKYFIRRAPDFYDWRSGAFKFTIDAELVQQESSRVCLEGSYQKYLALKPQKRHEKLLDIQSLLEEDCQTSERKAQLYSEQGNILAAADDYEEALASYDKALEIKPDYHYIWYRRGEALRNLGRYEKAIASYDQALKVEPDYYYPWFTRDNALSNLGRYEEAIASYDQALKVEPDSYAWAERVRALYRLERYEEANASCNKILEIQPDNHLAWYNKACCHALQGNVELALEDLQQAIVLSPDKYREMAKSNSDFDSIRDTEQFQTLI